MYLLKQEASKLLLPWPPFSTLPLCPSFPKPDLYRITHGPQMLLLRFPSSMGGEGTPSPELPVLLSSLVCPQDLSEGICPSPSTGRTQPCSCLWPWWEQSGKVPSQWGTSPHLWPLFLVLPQALAGETV